MLRRPPAAFGGWTGISQQVFPVRLELSSSVWLKHIGTEPGRMFTPDYCPSPLAERH
jgi:hypothetical protein